MNICEQRFLDMWLSYDFSKSLAMYHFQYFNYNELPLIQGMLYDVAALTEELSMLGLEKVVDYADTLPPKSQGHYPLSTFSNTIQEIHFVSAILKIWMYHYTCRMEETTSSQRGSLEKKRQNAENTIRVFCLGMLAPVPPGIELKVRRRINLEYGSRWTLEYDSMAIKRAKTELAFSILHEFGLQYRSDHITIS